MLPFSTTVTAVTMVFCDGGEEWVDLDVKASTLRCLSAPGESTVDQQIQGYFKDLTNLEETAEMVAGSSCGA